MTKFPRRRWMPYILTMGNFLDCINFDEEFFITLSSNVCFCYYLVQYEYSLD